MLGCKLSCAHAAPSKTPKHIPRHGLQNRKIALAYAQQLTSAQAGSNGRPDDGKPVLPVQGSRPSLPCERPLPLANIVEVQRLLFLLEAPEYCMRAFREHGVNGQDLLQMQEADLEDSRFKFPKPVQRKVMRIAHAWRTFLDMTGNPTQSSVTLEQCVAYYHRSSPASCCSGSAAAQLASAFRALDVNNNGNITFEEFLVGFALLEEAVSMKPPASVMTPGAKPSDSGAA